MTEIEQKTIKEMEAMLEEHFIANNHSNCDVGYSYSEIHFCKERDIKGVAHSIGTALVKAGYRKQEDTVKEFAKTIKRKRNDYVGYSMMTDEDLDELAEQFGKEGK